MFGKTRGKRLVTRDEALGLLATSPEGMRMLERQGFLHALHHDMFDADEVREARRELDGRRAAMAELHSINEMLEN